MGARGHGLGAPATASHGPLDARDVWRAFLRRTARFQTAILLSLVYLVAVGPSMLVGRLFGARLLDNAVARRRSSWRARRGERFDRAWLERQS